MQSEERRNRILNALKEADGPVSAGTLASRLDVSRQIIVGDIALLRASGEDITATPRGYVMSHAPAGLIRKIAVKHTSAMLEEELTTIVDMGCGVLDVIVDHPMYGEITGKLQLFSRYDISRYMERCSNAGAHPLSALTEGVHMHTISCPSEEAFERVVRELDRKGILLKTE